MRAVYGDAERLVAGVAVGVLDRDEAGHRLVGVRRVAERGRDLVRVERAVRPIAELEDARAHDDRVTGRLVPDDVALGAGDHLAAARHVGHQRHEVAHRPRRDEQAGLLAEQLRRPLLERVDRRVLAEDVVADLGGGHRAAHLGGRAGDGVGAEIDRGHRRRV